MSKGPDDGDIGRIISLNDRTQLQKLHDVNQKLMAALQTEQRDKLYLILTLWHIINTHHGGRLYVPEAAQADLPGGNVRRIQKTTSLDGRPGVIWLAYVQDPSVGTANDDEGPEEPPPSDAA